MLRYNLSRVFKETTDFALLHLFFEIQQFGVGGWGDELLLVCPDVTSMGVGKSQCWQAIPVHTEEASGSLFNLYKQGQLLWLDLLGRLSQMPGWV